MFDLPGGTYDGTLTVSITTVTPDAFIVYTTDGSAPDLMDTVYADPLKITTTTSLRAIGVAPGLMNSDIADAHYTISIGESPATPTFHPPGGAYYAPQSVSIASTTPGAALYYTTDGTTPTLASTLYTGPIEVTTSMTLKALGTAPNYGLSQVATSMYAIYTTTIPAAAPTISPDGGTYGEPVEVTLSTTEPNGTIAFTLDGTVPGWGGLPYQAPFTLTHTTTVTAVVNAPGIPPSTAAVSLFTLSLPPSFCAEPVLFSPASGTSDHDVAVFLDTATVGATICYNVGFLGPTCSYDGKCLGSSTFVDGEPILIETSGDVITARACAVGWESCGVSSSAYTLKAATPAFSRPAGTPTPLSPSTPNTLASNVALPAVLRYYDIALGEQAPVLNCSPGPLPDVIDAFSNSLSVHITGGRSLGAIVCKPGYLASDIAVADYPAAP